MPSLMATSALAHALRSDQQDQYLMMGSTVQMVVNYGLLEKTGLLDHANCIPYLAKSKDSQGS